MIDTVLQELIEFIKSASPFVWEALYRQVYVDAAGAFAFAGLLFAVASGLYRLGKRISDDDDSDGGEFFAFGLSALVGVAAFALLVFAAQRIANPNFYAIKFILENIQ